MEAIKIRGGWKRQAQGYADQWMTAGRLPNSGGWDKGREMNHGEKILIAEDEADVQELVSLHLRNAGFVPVNAENGPEAIRRAREDAPSLIVLDIMLAGMNGLEVCKLLKADTATSQIPLIMLTAKAEEPDRITGLELGADDYMTKPFSPRELVLRVKSVLRRASPAAAQETAQSEGGAWWRSTGNGTSCGCAGNRWN